MVNVNNLLKWQHIKGLDSRECRVCWCSFSIEQKRENKEEEKKGKKRKKNLGFSCGWFKKAKRSSSWGGWASRRREELEGEFTYCALISLILVYVPFRKSWFLTWFCSINWWIHARSAMRSAWVEFEIVNLSFTWNSMVRACRSSGIGLEFTHSICCF